ncbi:MAG TPA: ribosome silencing factor [Methylomirabilota bacterium]|nr:ribosome silencing factor [Methylomirabilota bacterium]
MPLTAEEKARLGALAALEKKATDLVVLNLQGISNVTDYFLICSGSSTTQLATIAEAIETRLDAEGRPPLHREGPPESGWMLLDYGDVVMHIFLRETRAHYALEHLWGDAPELALEPHRGG